MINLHFTSSQSRIAQDARARLIARYGQRPLDGADVVVALGGDGFMLEIMHQNRGLPVYGMNRGTVGFIMNDFEIEDLPERIASAEETVVNPLAMTAAGLDGGTHTALAVNEVSLLRSGPQAARLRVSVNGRARMDELVCDGALVCTPTGSTAYNYSAGGPILPMGSDVLALTAIAAYRPRRWRGAIVPREGVVRFDVIDPQKRPVMAMADGDADSMLLVEWVEVSSDESIGHRLLFDANHGLEERLMREQFV